jgi:hypothetical protein
LRQLLANNTAALPIRGGCRIGAQNVACLRLGHVAAS